MFFSFKGKNIKFTIFILDIIITMFSFALALFVRKYIFNVINVFDFDFYYYSILFVITILLWLILIQTHNPIPNLPNYSFKHISYDIIKKVSLGIVFIVAISFLIKGIIISRLFIFIFGVINIVSLLIERKLFIIYKRKQYQKGNNLTNVLVVGNCKDTDKVANIIRSHRDWGVLLIDVWKPDFGNSKQFVHKLKTMHIDVIIFTIEKDDMEKFKKIANIITEAGIDVMLYLNTLFPVDSFIHYDSFLGMNFLNFNMTTDRTLSLYVKYFLDKIFSIVLLLILSPLLLLIALLIWIFNGKPIIFTQQRVGMNGELFNMYKFRTMTKNAEEEKILLHKKNEMSGPVFKIKNDPRITKFGRFLRRFSLDELPQLYNILKGEMSFVGPRPPLQEEVKEYKLWQRRRLSMKPGLTCTWQISGRNNIDFTKWMYMDMEYIDNWSLLYDVIILIKTIPVIITGKGAL